MEQTSLSRSTGSQVRELTSNERIRLAHEKTMHELDASVRSYKEKYRRLRESTQLELLGIVAYRHVYKEYSYSADDVQALGLDSSTENLHKKSAQRKKSQQRNDHVHRGGTQLPNTPTSSTENTKHIRKTTTPKSTRISQTYEHDINTQNKQFKNSQGKDSAEAVKSKDTLTKPILRASSKPDAPPRRPDISFFLTDAIEEEEEEEDDLATSECFTYETYLDKLSTNVTDNKSYIKEPSDLTSNVTSYATTNVTNTSRATVSACNTSLWKYILLPSLVPQERKKKPVVTKSKQTYQYVPTRPKKERLKLWETATSRSDRQSKVFPENCKNTYAFRRLVEEKANKLIHDWSPSNVRRIKARCILDTALADPPVLVDRQRTTSALFRDYREIQSRRGRSPEQAAVSRKSNTSPVESLHSENEDIQISKLDIH